MKEKNIELRKNIIIILITIALLLIFVYLINYIIFKNKERLSESYLVRNNTVINQINNVSELKQVLKESPNKLILYVTYHNSNKIYKIEKKISDEINKYDVQDIMYIFDFTSIKEKVDNYALLINDALDINVTKFPVVVYYENGQIASYKVINNKDDITNLFNKYNIEKK